MIKNLNLYPPRGNRKEVNLRSEISKTINGSGIEFAKGQYGLLRRMRRNSEGNLLPCPCIDPTTKEEDRDIRCPICMGDRYLWDEEIVRFYKMLIVTSSRSSQASRERFLKPGYVNLSLFGFFLEYDKNIREEDRIVEIKLNVEGEIVRPIIRSKLFVISNISEHRSDNGRIEYYQLDTRQEYRKFLNG